MYEHEIIKELLDVELSFKTDLSDKRVLRFST